MIEANFNELKESLQSLVDGVNTEDNAELNLEQAQTLSNILFNFISEQELVTQKQNEWNILKDQLINHILNGHILTVKLNDTIVGSIDRALIEEKGDALFGELDVIHFTN